MNILLMDFNRGTVHKPTKIKEFFEPISDANPFAKFNIRTDVSQLKFKNCKKFIPCLVSMHRVLTGVAALRQRRA